MDKDLQNDLDKAIKRMIAAEDLIKEIMPAAKFQSCGHRDESDADPCFHCCDWREWVEKVKTMIGVG